MYPISFSSFVKTLIKKSPAAGEQKGCKKRKKNSGREAAGFRLKNIQKTLFEKFRGDKKN